MIEQQLTVANGSTWTVRLDGDDVTIDDQFGSRRYEGRGHIHTAIHLAIQLAALQPPVKCKICNGTGVYETELHDGLISCPDCKT